MDETIKLKAEQLVGDIVAESALKRVYLAIHEASQRWTMPIVGRRP